MLEAPEFLLEHGRLPRIDDDPKPWKYRGWLLLYLQMTEIQLRGTQSRWAYQLELWDTGELPDDPIPPLHFGQPDPTVYRELERWARLVGYDDGGWSDFRSLMDWFLWGLALARDEPELYRADAAEKLYRQANLGLMLKAPYDYFGAFISERKSKNWNPTAFFPTPHSVVECMVRMLMADGGRDGRHRKVMDPCVGTGRMLLHASNYSLRLYGHDIDPMVLAGCRINGALYAPWMSYGLPDSVFAAEDWFSDVTAPEFAEPAPVGKYQPSLFDCAIEDDY